MDNTNRKPDGHVAMSSNEGSHQAKVENEPRDISATPNDHRAMTSSTDPESRMLPATESVRVRRLLATSSPIDIIRNTAISPNSMEAGTINLAMAIEALSVNSKGTLEMAIQNLKKINVKTFAKATWEYINQVPRKSAVVALSVAIPVICGIATPAILTGIGFTATGIAAGSIAAGIQAGIGNVAAGSLFAALTSAGMGGFALPIVIGIVVGVTGLASLGFAVWWLWSGKEDNEGVKEDEALEET